MIYISIYVVFDFKKARIPSSVLSPEKSTGVLLLAGKYLRVGKPWIGIPSISLAVASHLAKTTFGLMAASP